jgi:hypothetical protein
MLLTIVKGIKFVQIPVTYRERVGMSSVTGDFGKAFKLGLQMIVFIIWAWFGFILERFAGRRQARPAANDEAPAASEIERKGMYGR